MTGFAIYALLGASLLVATLLPGLTNRIALSPPMVLVGMGMLIGLLPLPSGISLAPEANRGVITHVTELTVLVSLMGVGLALDRRLDLRSLSSWRAWSPVWRLLAIGMPLTVLGVALLGWWVAGLAPAVALLLGSVLAPTDPVLASDVQVGEPVTEQGERDPDEKDDIRFALTAEAGLNDGLAFPFVHLSLLLLAGGFAVGDAAEWLGLYVVVKIAVGVVVGLVAGRALGRLAFHSRTSALRLAEQGEPLLALAALLLAYGAAELAQGYGFLAVFACAMALRDAERGHGYQRDMHALVERLERLMTLAVLLALGIAMTNGLFSAVDWRGVVVALALLLVVRPLAAWVAIAVRPRDQDSPGGLDLGERRVVAFFGVRGVGSLFYLGYATSHHEIPSEAWLWSTVSLTVVLSVLLHGMTATPVMARLDARRARDV